MHSFIFRNKEFSLERYPETSNRSLLPFSNAELLALNHVENREITTYHLFNDRFGIWNCALHEQKVTTVWNYASQKKAIVQNLQRNDLLPSKHDFKGPLEKLDIVEVALMKVPKSLELFELYLNQIHRASNGDTEVVCGFMTKYFNKSLLKIASNYFEEVRQSLAWKKARLLILKRPKENIQSKELINSIAWGGEILQQYYGVFSSGKVDIGTQYLLEDLRIHETEEKILDLASGNGVIAKEVLKLDPNAKLTLIDDSNLATESSKLNLSDKANYVCDDNLSQLSSNSFDLVVSNPPFHFEYENNIEVSVSLFEEVGRCLKKDGRFLLIANKHLNYKTHLLKYFRKVTQLKSNDKFEVLECVK